MLFTRPVSKLSNTITSCSPPIRRSTRCEPKNPAPPVISTRISVYLCIRQHLVGRRKRLSQPRSPALLQQAPGTFARFHGGPVPTDPDNGTSPAELRPAANQVCC